MSKYSIYLTYVVIRHKCQGRANEQGIHEVVNLVMRRSGMYYVRGSGKAGLGVVKEESQIKDSSKQDQDKMKKHETLMKSVWTLVCYCEKSANENGPSHAESTGD